MSNGFEFWIGRRYVRSRSNNSFVSLISAISMLGIAIAVTVLIVVMSVVNGFERELKDRLLAMTAHASISATEGQLANSSELIKIAVNNSRVSAAVSKISCEVSRRYRLSLVWRIDNAPLIAVAIRSTFSRGPSTSSSIL